MHSVPTARLSVQNFGPLDAPDARIPNNQDETDMSKHGNAVEGTL